MSKHALFSGVTYTNIPHEGINAYLRNDDGDLLVEAGYDLKLKSSALSIDVNGALLNVNNEDGDLALSTCDDLKINADELSINVDGISLKIENDCGSLSLSSWDGLKLSSNTLSVVLNGNAGGEGQVLTSNGQQCSWQTPSNSLSGVVGSLNVAELTLSSLVDSTGVKGTYGQMLVSDGTVVRWGGSISNLNVGNLTLSGLIDSTGGKGTNGQVLVSDGTVVKWGGPIPNLNVGELTLSSLVDSTGVKGISGQVLVSDGTAVRWGALPAQSQLPSGGLPNQVLTTNIIGNPQWDTLNAKNILPSGLPDQLLSLDFMGNPVWKTVGARNILPTGFPNQVLSLDLTGNPLWITQNSLSVETLRSQSSTAIGDLTNGATIYIGNKGDYINPATYSTTFINGTVKLDRLIDSTNTAGTVGQVLTAGSSGELRWAANSASPGTLFVTNTTERYAYSDELDLTRPQGVVVITQGSNSSVTDRTVVLPPADTLAVGFKLFVSNMSNNGWSILGPNGPRSPNTVMIEPLLQSRIISLNPGVSKTLTYIGKFVHVISGETPAVTTARVVWVVG